MEDNDITTNPIIIITTILFFLPITWYIEYLNIINIQSLYIRKFFYYVLGSFAVILGYNISAIINILLHLACMIYDLFYLIIDACYMVSIGFKIFLHVLLEDLFSK